MDILVVDDNKDVITSLKRVLTDFRVIGAVTSAQAKKIIDKHENIGLLIIDVKLGNDDGIEILKYAKAKHPLTECIMISGYSTIEKAVDAIKSGAYDFLEKPLSFHGEMPLAQQTKLLRTMEDGEFFRLGSEEKLKAEFRLISATNKDLESLINSGSFRADLFYRISALKIYVPSLRERREEIPELVEYFLRNIFLEYGGTEKHLTDEALNKISSLHLKGNVRELKNLIQQLHILSENEEITANDIKRYLFVGFVIWIMRGFILVLFCPLC